MSVADEGSDDPFIGRAGARERARRRSRRPSGRTGRAASPSRAPNGRYVAFASTATNLVADGGTAGRKSIYVRDMLLGKTFRVEGAGEPDGDSYDPDLSDDGRHLVFTSEATNLSAGDTNGTHDSFVADLDANGDGILGDIAVTRFLGDVVIEGGTEQARISGNGAAVVFTAHRTRSTRRSRRRGRPATSSSAHALRANAASRTRSATSRTTPPSTPGGDTFAYIDEDECDGMPAIVAGTLDSDYLLRRARDDPHRSAGGLHRRSR